MVNRWRQRGAIAPKIILLIALGIIILGGATVGIITLVQEDDSSKCPGGICPAATSTSPFPEPDWAPRTQCGDGVCNPNEKANPNACPQDCIAVELPPPTIDSFTAIPTTVVAGQTTSLSWSSTSTFCAAAGDESSWFVTGGAPKGSAASKPLYAPRTFILSCMAEDGETITKSITVNVTAPPTPVIKVPVITMSASPESIGKGKTSTITWSVANATSCVGSGGGTSGWAGTRTTKGTFTTPTLSARQSYTLTCTGKGRSSSRSVTVAVAEGPQVTFTATPSKTTSGEKVTLAWLAPNATSCTASGSGAEWGWSGTLPSSGVQTTAPLKESQSFTVTCENNVGGSTTKIAQVVVATPKLSLSISPTSQTIAYGKSASIRWTSTGATSCTGSGPWVDSVFGLSDAKLTRPLTESAVLEITCTGEGGTVTQKAAVNMSAAAKCSFGGTQVSHGASVTAYKSSTVAYGGECVSETRTCENGTLSGSYLYASCAAGEAKSCTSTTFGTVQHDASVVAYQSSMVQYGDSCASEVRTCANGTLSGSYDKKSCEIEMTRKICIDHILYIKVEYSGLNAKLKWVDTNPDGVKHANCSTETSYANADPKDSDGWHIYKQVTIPPGKSKVNFCVNSVCTVGSSANATRACCGAAGPQYPTFDWIWNFQ